ncbi:Receptor-like serine/threonine-protein kinase ALE2 [Acorus calamus]|uniref:Receptor-like serine/threonine-protein kinase ALE2 n=1 Tax=Acorus calamus TaxID=4465 RepID=A0AAV9EKE5_ACOCL|nr:Receptor-like serine/threonine-protein kinase ALE2 [Acorus calamus]
MRFLLLLVLLFLLDLGSFGYARQVSNVPAFSSSMPPAVWASKPSLAPSPAPSPMHHGYATGPRGGRHQRRTPNAAPPNAFIPWRNEGCDEVNCPDSQTPTPIGSPCGCVLPMQVELDLGVTPYVIFPLIPELEVEVAKGTYLKQSQVRIMGASADLQDLDKTVVNIFLVPLGEKFDNTTALLIYERFSQRKIPLNATLFGDYDVISIQYPGLPATPPSGSRPSGSDVFPITANVHDKSHRMNSRTIAIVVLALFALLLVCFAVSYILIKWMKARGSSTMVRPTFTSSITKRSGIESFLSSSFPSLASPSLISTMAPCMLSVKTFLLSELEKATDKFSSKRFLGKGGFGEVYHGIMEDGTEIAVKKLLMREDQNRDREFIAEVEMLSRLHHRNLVKLIGICIDEQIRCVVYELVRNGSVESHLHGSDKRRGSLDWDTRMKIALGAARALAYLHEDSNPRVIHRDFKASNVLLENDFTPKVSDFGLAREASEEGQHISTRVMGTFG